MLIELCKLLGLAAVFVVGVTLGASAEMGRRAVRCLVWGGVAFALFAVISFVSRHAWADPRLNAGLSSANCAATVFGVLTCLTLPLFFQDRGRTARARLETKILARAVPAAALLLFLVCLMLTASRGGLISALVGFGVFAGLLAAISRLKIRVIAPGIVVLAIGVAGLLLFKGQLALERLAATPVTDASRSVIFAQVWKTIEQAPLQGFGLGSFAELKSFTLDPAIYGQAWAVRDVHNVYLQWLVEGGVAGALVMFATVGLMIASAAVGLFRSTRNRTWLAGLLAADAVVLVHGLSDFALQVPSIAAMWALILGLQFGWWRQPRGRS